MCCVSLRVSLCLLYQIRVLAKTTYVSDLNKLDTLLHKTHIKVLRIDMCRSIILLANSANTECRPFRVKIYFSIFIIDGLQQRCRMIFLVSLFVTSRNLLFGVFLARKIITISQKIAGIFRQVLLKGVLLSVSILKCFGKTFSKYLWKSRIFKKPLLHMNVFASHF